MATRSTIAMEYEDGTIRQIYCHWAGYLSHNGKILLEHYSNPEKVKALIGLGDISSLAPNIGGEGKLFDTDTPDANTVIAYHRDKGEQFCLNEAVLFNDFEDYIENLEAEEVQYIFINGKWFFHEKTDALKPEYFYELTEMMIK